MPEISIKIKDKVSTEGEILLEISNQFCLQISVDLPGYDARDDAFFPVKEGTDAGHVFITIIHKNIQDNTEESECFGFYPAVKSGYVKGDYVKGSVIDDWARYRDAEYFISISEEGYKKSIVFARTSFLQPPAYNLYKYNCVDYVVDVAAHAGINLPSNLTPLGFKNTMDKKRF